MEDCRKIREMIIDNFYGEGGNSEVESHLKICSECREFAREFGIMLKNMDVENDLPVSHYDIASILDKAEEIQRGRHRGVETVAFICTALLVLAAFVLLTLRFGLLFIVISQVLVGMNLPLVLLAARRMREAKEV